MISRDKKIMYDVIILVGIDGCGKSTQINLLADYLKNKVAIKKLSNVSIVEPVGSIENFIKKNQ